MCGGGATCCGHFSLLWTSVFIPFTFHLKSEAWPILWAPVGLGHLFSHFRGAFGPCAGNWTRSFFLARLLCAGLRQTEAVGGFL